jgi:ATP-binding cassette subfamily B protein
VFHRQAQDLDKFSRENSRLAELNVRQNMIGQGFFAAIQAFLQVSPALIYLTAAFVLYRGGDITAGTVVAFTTLQTRLFFPLGNLLQTIVELRSSLAYFERIFDYLDLVPDITEAEHPISLDKATTEGRVDYDSVEFSYDEGANTLNGITLNVEPGKLLALVGPSGAGKTTIGYLLPRLYDVTGGSVKIDGVDVREMSFDSLASIVGMVSQESYLFHANIRDNLKYGNREATDEQVIAAAQAAAIHDRIMSFPSGYDTMVGERGYRLSGGEKQRVAIARVLLHNPKVLLLDEATSALDTTSERLVQGALTNAMAGRTTIAIAHRLSTIQAADSIAVIDAGRVVEQGTHDQLLARGGLYASLYREQFGDGSIEARCSDGILLRDGTIVPNDLNHPVTVGANPSPSAVE